MKAKQPFQQIVVEQLAIDRQKKKKKRKKEKKTEERKEPQSKSHTL